MSWHLSSSVNRTGNIFLCRSQETRRWYVFAEILCPRKKKREHLPNNQSGILLYFCFLFIYFKRQRIFYLLSYFSNAHNSHDWAPPKLGDHNSIQVSNGLPHQLPPVVHISRKLELEAKLGLKPRPSNTGCRPPKQYLNHCT